MGKTVLPLPQNWQHDNTLGFNLSTLVLKKNPAAEEAAHRLIQHILDTTDMTICFTHHVILPGNDDYEMLKELQEMFADTSRTILLPADLDATELKGYIARMRFFIGARTHATIAAYSSLVPTMVLGYSIKSKGIAKDLFGEEKLVLNIDEISDPEKLIAAFEQMQLQEAELKQILTRRIPEIRKMAEKAAEHVLNLF
jgi:polysaccharide pyruvyl transferase WcaK-like protein